MELSALPGLLCAAGASWAFAAAAAIDSAWAITHNSSAPLVSRQEFLECTRDHGNGCQAGHPGDAFEYAAGLGEAGTGLKDAVRYQYLARPNVCSAQVKVGWMRSPR